MSMPVKARMCDKKPDYQYVDLIIPQIYRFYEDPENEKAFQEWKAQRSGKNETVKG